MQKKPFIIGITGNIASGKSVVSQYLQNLGALVIDADVLAQRVMMQGAPVFSHVVEAFSEHILDSSGEINRRILANLVFSDVAKLEILEQIIHPHVLTAAENIIGSSDHPVIVFEAIKLFESGFAKRCDSIWTAAASDSVRLQRLVTERNMPAETAWQRIEAQPPQEEKFPRSNFVIHTDHSFAQTCQQVQAAFDTIGLKARNYDLMIHLEGGKFLRKLKLFDTELLSNFFQKQCPNGLNDEACCRLMGKQSFWGVISNNELIAMISSEQKVGIAGFFEYNVLNKDPEMTCFFLHMIPNLFPVLRAEFVEKVVFKANLLNKECKSIFGGKPGTLETLPYAYHSTMLQNLQTDDEIICYSLVSAEKYNQIFYKHPNTGYTYSE